MMAEEVPHEIVNELNQILSNLVLGDNEIRRSAERILNEKWLASQPEAVLLALVQLTRQSPEHHMRSFAAVLTRRLLFRALPPAADAPHTNMSIYDHLSESTRKKMEGALLMCLSEETDEGVRKKVVDTITDIALGSMERGRPWPALQTVALECTQSAIPGHRECAFRIFAAVPIILLDHETRFACEVLERGLKDAQSFEVRLAAARASTAYLVAADQSTQSHALSLMYPLLETLPPLSVTHLPSFLRALNPLASSRPALFRPHLSSLLTFLFPLVLPPPTSSLFDATPTAAHPHTFSFPPTPTSRNSTSLHFQDSGRAENTTYPPEDEETDAVRHSALELLISITEARPTMVKECPGWVSGVVRCCLEGMAEIRDGQAGTTWADTEDPHEEENDFGYSYVFEESLDRLACALGGEALLPIAFQYIPAMLASHDWMQRHAGLMAIASIAEGTHKVMEKELNKIISLVTPMFKDIHPRVRYAACQCIGQLCTDLEEIVQELHYREIFAVLIPTLRDPEPRVHSHAAAAMINFCAGVDRETLRPYLDDIVGDLLSMLNVTGRRYVQEQAITTLAMVADASAEIFRKYYGTIMPNLLNVLRGATHSDLRTLRCKVMECAGLIANAVGTDMFKADAAAFAQLLLEIQEGVTEPDDPTSHYLISTWAKVCTALGPSFEPYLPYVMPPLLRSAAVKADVAIVDEDASEKEGWELIDMDGQQVGIRTATLEEKCTAFDMLLTHCATLGPKFAPYLPRTLELALPGLKFFFHDGVREACAMLIPVLIVCGKESGTLTPTMLNEIFGRVVSAISCESDPSYLASLYKCFTDSARVVQTQSLTLEQVGVVVKATQNHLQVFAQKRRARNNRIQGMDWEEEKEDILLMEDMENFALDAMSKMLELFDKSHPLLIAIGSIKEMGVGERWEGDSNGSHD
ncbi:hypothetical protein BOTBODRAFT_158816 [Botryobasidium botryosum FD-172 SS1]|uniref:TOG domain-containing protein n=1 Tax=Botryobasidium botryosum (strain FD-172 SS1) TaxID=930990 RepID=A0A067MH97_BOTB1|nr:hypothetical protein BOTBODRAFT_158816 [Botryobasidium botryosum FD-172 SS1]